MFISLMNGGLGNQVFQYIFARYLELTTKNPVLIDDHIFFLTKENTELSMPDIAGQARHNGFEIENVFPNSNKPVLLSEYFEPDVWEYMVNNAKASNGGMANIAQQLLDNGLDLTMVAEAVDPHSLAFTGTKLATPGNCFNSSVIYVPENTYFYGYWINPGWFNAYKNIFRKELSFGPIEDPLNKQYEREIRKSFSIGVHVRRGDFVLHNWQLPESYYNDVNTQLTDRYPDATFFVFSDDLAWCKENMKQLGLPKKTVFVEGNFNYKSNYVDMQLMTLCKGLVVGNSSFSYLASILNETPGFFAVQTRNPPQGNIAQRPQLVAKG